MLEIKRKNTPSLVFYGVLIVLFLYGIFGYITTETTSFVFRGEFSDVEQLCKKQTPGEVSYYKILSYNSAKGTAKSLCVYQSREDSLILHLIRSKTTHNWEVITKSNADGKGELYWPVYT